MGDLTCHSIRVYGNKKIFTLLVERKMRKRRELAFSLACAGMVFGILGCFDYSPVFGSLACVLGGISLAYAPATERGLGIASVLLGAMAWAIWLVTHFLP